MSYLCSSAHDQERTKKLHSKGEIWITYQKPGSEKEGEEKRLT